MTSPPPKTGKRKLETELSKLSLNDVKRAKNG
jgi:hypothetical protein